MINVETIEELEIRIGELESSLEELVKEKDYWSDMFDSTLQSYNDLYANYESCIAEINMLLKICKDNGIEIPDDEHYIDLEEIQNS
jgi:hypothetical protein